MNTTSTATSTRWWLALDGRPDGPRTIAYITAAVQAGQVTLTTPACPEGGCEWKPLAIWPELAALATAQQQSPPSFPSTSLLPAAKASAVGNDDRLLTNDLLPPMANLICVYTILIVPLFWIFGFVVEGGSKRRRRGTVGAVEIGGAHGWISEKRQDRGVSLYLAQLRREAQECDPTWSFGKRFVGKC